MVCDVTSGAPTSRTYGVKLIRGPLVALASHPQACDSVDELLRLRRTLSGPVAADLFCGAGGMSLGLQDAGYNVIVGVDNDEVALETYRGYLPGLALRRDLADPADVREVATVLRRAKVDLIAGGPPCQPFSRAGRSKIRSLVAEGLRDHHDRRRDLWQAFLDIVAIVRPAQVLLENVPEMALGDDLVVLRTMVDELEELDYRVFTRLVDAWRYGVPQFRQRLIMVAVRKGQTFTWPVERAEIVTVDNAIGDLPEVEGGWRPAGGAAGFSTYSGPRTSFQRSARAGLSGAETSRVYDHITRPVRDDDASAFAQMDSETSYGDIDPALRRYRTDIFDDKYKRLSGNELSRSITAHIARDGYWYIHPRQDRTLTIREAARIQTFPDRFRFAGPPSAAFRQIGNAVPPLLAQRIGVALRASAPGVRRTVSSRQLSAALRAWIADQTVFSVPWLAAETAWQVVSAEILLQRATPLVVASAWPILEKLDEPEMTLERSDDIRMMGAWMKRPERTAQLLTAASELTSNPERLLSVDGLAATTGITNGVAAIAGIVTQLDGASPVPTSQAVLRCAARFCGEPVDRVNKQSHGRMAVGRMIGAGEDRNLATVGLMELATQVCTLQNPSCSRCPLAKWCASRHTSN